MGPGIGGPTTGGAGSAGPGGRDSFWDSVREQWERVRGAREWVHARKVEYASDEGRKNATEQRLP